MQLSIYILNKNLPNNYYINIYCPCIIIHNSSLDVSQSKHEVKGSNFEKNNKCSKFFGLKKFFVKDLEIDAMGGWTLPRGIASRSARWKERVTARATCAWALDITSHDRLPHLARDGQHSSTSSSSLNYDYDVYMHTYI